VEASIGFGKAR